MLGVRSSAGYGNPVNKVKEFTGLLATERLTLFPLVLLKAYFGLTYNEAQELNFTLITQ